LSLTLLFVLLSPNASAENQAKNQDRVQNITTDDEETVTTSQNDEEEEDEEESGAPGIRIRNSVRNLERVVTRFRDPEDGNQVREMVEEQTQVEERVQILLSSMDARPGFLRFILGPDYKNAGEVRSQIVRLEAQIEQLTRLKEKLTLQEDQDSVQEAIDSLEAEADALESELSEKLEGFSLFGWLAKLFAQY